MIPKHMYFFWDAKTPLSWMRFLTIKTFCILNPDWKITLYISKCHGTKAWKDNVEQDFFKYTGKDYLEEASKLIDIKEWEESDLTPTHTSNMFKYKILTEKGGYYSDLDILYTKPMLEISNKMVISCTPYLSIGLLGAEEGNKFFREAYINGLSNLNPNHYQCLGVENLYDMLYFHQVWNKERNINWNWIHKQNIPKDIKKRYGYKVYNISKHQLYAFGHDIDLLYRRDLPVELFTQEMFGIHWYAGNPKSQKFNSKLSKRQMGANTFANFIRSVL